jgi:hypothetical protein
MMTRPDRRQLDANAAINLCIVRGIVSVALIQTVGNLLLVGMGLPVTEGALTIITAITSGLIGYLARDPKHPPGANVTTERVENMNVEAPPADPVPKPGGGETP